MSLKGQIITSKTMAQLLKTHVIRKAYMLLNQTLDQVEG